MTCFLPFRERYNVLFEGCFQDIFIDPRKSSSGIQLAKGLLATHAIDLEDVLHQTAIETMAACLCRVGEAMPTKERMLKLSRAGLSFSYTSDLGWSSPRSQGDDYSAEEVGSRPEIRPEYPDCHPRLRRPLSENFRTSLADGGSHSLHG